MGSSRKPKSTRRATKARSVKPTPKPGHTPAATAVLPPAAPLSRNNAFAKDLCRRLELIHDVVITVAIALEKENAEHDLDFANVLTRCAADPLWGIIVELGGADEEVDHD